VDALFVRTSVLGSDSVELSLTAQQTFAHRFDPDSVRYYYALRGSTGDTLASDTIPRAAAGRFLDAVDSAARLARASASAGGAKGERPVKFDKDARMLRTRGLAQYPDSLRLAGIEGVVLVQFIVGKDGRVERGSEQILACSHDAFRDAVLTALPDLRYEPAILGGRPARQVVQQPFAFAPSR